MLPKLIYTIFFKWLFFLNRFDFSHNLVFFWRITPTGREENIYGKNELLSTLTVVDGSPRLKLNGAKQFLPVTHEHTQQTHLKTPKEFYKPGNYWDY